MKIRLISPVVGCLLAGAFGVHSADAVTPALTLTVNPANKASITSAVLGLTDATDVVSFSLELSFMSGSTLSLPLTPATESDPTWFSRGGYFPATRFASYSTNLNGIKVSSVGNRVYLNGFAPSVSAGNIGSVALNVSKDAIPCDSTNTVANGLCSFQWVTLSGKYFSMSQKQVVSFAPLSSIFTTSAVTTNKLTVTLAGTGSGTVNGTPPDANNIPIACAGGSSGACTGTYYTGTQITLRPTVSGSSTFGGWSANCTRNGDNCLITLTADTTVTATFTAPQIGSQVQLVGTPNQTHGTIASAYTSAGTAGTSTIKAQAVAFIGDLLMGLLKNIKLFGGYDSTFTTQTGYTTVQGKVTIGAGSLVVDRVIVK